MSHQPKFCVTLVDKLPANQGILKINPLQAAYESVTFVFYKHRLFNVEAALCILQLRRADKIDILHRFISCNF